jgi:hypothetical protein
VAERQSRSRAMTQEDALSYRVSRNGSAGDWYWEVISDRKIVSRGLAPHEGTSPRAGPGRLRHATRSGSQRIPRYRSKVSRLYRHLEDFHTPLIDD